MMRRSLAALVAVVALTFCGVAQAAAPALRRIAVVVGANDPPPGRSPLRFARDDANELAGVLVQVGGFASADVQVLSNPRPSELIATLDAAAVVARSSGGDVLFLFYYSGHSDGQALFPHGEPVLLADVRTRVERVGARIRIGIMDACRGGSWTQSKGLSVGPPPAMGDLLNLDTEGTVLVSASSGMENAHESDVIRGSFFTHYLTAGLRGAADREGDGTVTLQEAFDYAKERTVRESARIAHTPQHPSFDLALRGRQDVVLSVVSQGAASLQVPPTRAPLEIIHLPSGVTVADVPAGQRALRIAIPPGRYLVRRVVDGHVYAREVEVRARETSTLTEGELEAAGAEELAIKGAENPLSSPSSDPASEARVPLATVATTPVPSTTGRMQRTVGLAIAGVGVVSLGTGVVTAFLAKSQAAGVASSCAPSNGCGPSEETSRRNSANQLAVASDILLAGGIAAVGSGVAVFLLAPHWSPTRSVSVGIAPGDFYVRGTF